MTRYQRGQIESRILEKVIFEGDCWVWQGATINGKYGRIRLRKTGEDILVHRFYWEVEPYQRLHDTCGNTLCINWNHWTLTQPKSKPTKPRKRATECKHCERALRPTGRTLAEFPDTITHAGLGMCNSCKNAVIEKLDAEAREIVYRKVPRDLWSYFGLPV